MMAMYCSLCYSVCTSNESLDYRCKFCENGMILADFTNSVPDDQCADFERLIFRCPFCEQDYLNREGLWNHLSLHKITDSQKAFHCNEMIVRYDLHECLICNDRRGYSEDLLRVHKLTAHDGFSLQCLFCNKLFRSKEHKLEHSLKPCIPNTVDVNSHKPDSSPPENNLHSSSEATAKLDDHQLPSIPKSNKAVQPTVAGDRSTYMTSFEMFCQKRTDVQNVIQGIIDKSEMKRSQWNEVIGNIVTGHMSFVEASVHYKIPRYTLYHRVLGSTSGSVVLKEISLSSEEVDEILNFCTDVPLGCGLQKAVVEPLERIWEFMQRFQAFREKADHFRFGEVTFFRWWWAFCRYHKVDVWPSKRLISDDNEISNSDDKDVGTIVNWREAIADVVFGRLNLIEASSIYGLPKGGLFYRIFGSSDRSAILHRIPLSPGEEALILRFSVKIFRGRTKKKAIAQPLDKIWEFMNRFLNFRKKAEEFKFGGVTFFRWWWAFCGKHNVDPWSTNHFTSDDSEISIEDVGATTEWKEAVFDIVTGQLSIVEASYRYNIPTRTLYCRILGQTDRLAVLQEISLSTEEEEQILRFGTKNHPTRPVITERLEKIWDFANSFQNFQNKADQFRFGGIAFFRWWWAFCLSHNVDVWPRNRKPRDELVVLK